MLMAYPDGHPIIVTYFHQNIGPIDIRTAPSDLSNTLHRNHYDFTKINQLEMRLINQLESEKEDDDNTITLTGTAIYYPSVLTPYVGDMFQLDVGDGKIMIFVVDNVTPTTYRQGTYYELTFNSWTFLDEEMYDWLASCTKETVYFKKKKYFGESELTFLNEQSYIDLMTLERLNKELKQFFVRKFFSPDWESFVRPDNIYDPYVTEFVRKKISIREFDIRPLQLYSRMRDYYKTLWDKFTYAADKDTLTDIACYYHVKYHVAEALATDINALINNNYIALGYDSRDIPGNSTLYQVESTDDSTTDVPVYTETGCKNYCYCRPDDFIRYSDVFVIRGTNAEQQDDYIRMLHGLPPIHTTGGEKHPYKGMYCNCIANKKVCTAYTTCTCIPNQYKNTPAMVASSCGSMTYGKSAVYSTTSINGGGANNNCNCNSNCCNSNCTCTDSSVSDGTIRYSKPYIFNTDFYNGFVDSMNDLEFLVYNYLVHNELDIKKVLELASQYRKMPLMDAFYKVPVLMELVDVAIRKIT